MARDTVIPNQVFIGLPWKNVRVTYDGVIDKLRTKYPIYFVIVGREGKQDAEDLLEVIKSRIQDSSFAIFDATDGNANVSLEYGYTEAMGVKRALYMSSRKKMPGRLESPIISDLAGKSRNHYKSVKTLRKLLDAFCKDHAYTKRFERFVTDSFRRKPKGEKKRRRSLALKIIRALDSKPLVRRDDVVNELQGDISKYGRAEIDEMIRRLNNGRLIQCPPGRHSKISIR